jgi:hypothetical protein
MATAPRNPGGYATQTFRLHLTRMEPDREVVLQWSEQDVTARLYVDRTLAGQSADTYGLQTTDDQGRRINLTWGYHVDGVLWVKQDDDWVHVEELSRWDLAPPGRRLLAVGWAALPLVVLFTGQPLLMALAWAATAINLILTMRGHTARRGHVVTGLITASVLALALLWILVP